MKESKLRAKIKVVFVLPSLGGGGAERVMTLVAKHLSLDNFEPYLIVVTEHSNKINPSELPDNVIRLKKKKMSLSHFALLKEIKKIAPAIVISSVVQTNLFISLTKIFYPRSIRFIVRESSIPSVRSHGFNTKLYNFIYKKIYPTLDAIVCQSLTMQNDLVNTYNISERKLTVIMNPIQHVSVGIDDSKEVDIIYVGGLTKHKQVDLLLKAIPLLNNKNLKVNIIGTGPEENKLKALCSDLNISGQVSFLGFKKNAQEYMAQARLLVLVSLYEGMPNVVLEAHQVGTPTVTLKMKGGTEELINEGVNGYVTKSRTVEDLATTIDKALSRNFDSMLIKEGVESKHNLVRIMQQYEKLFKDVVHV